MVIVSLGNSILSVQISFLRELPALHSRGLLLVHLGCYNKNIIGLVAYKQQMLTSHSFGGRKSKIMVDLVSGKSPLPSSSMAIFPPSSLGGRGKGDSGLSSVRAPVPFTRGQLSRPNYFSKAPPTNTSTLWVRI